MSSFTSSASRLNNQSPPNIGMSSFQVFLVFTLCTLAACRPDVSDKAEARDDDGSLGRRGATGERNPILDYLLRNSANELPPGSKREFSYLQAFPENLKPIQKPNIITETSKPNVNFQRDPNKSPYENFSGYILAGRKPEQNLVKSPVLNFRPKENLKVNKTYTKMERFPATATVIQTFDEKGTLRSSFTRYEPAGSNPPTADQTRQQLTWPYAGYFPILIKDPFLTAYNTFASGGSFSFSSLVEYGPEADICRTKEGREEHEAHIRNTRSLKMDEQSEINNKKVEAAEEVGRRQVMARRTDDDRTPKTTKITVADQEKGIVSIRLESPRTESDEPQLTVRKGGVSIAGPGGFATAYTGGTAVVGPYGTVFKSPLGEVVAGPYSKIINITDETSFSEILRMYESAKINKTNPTFKKNSDVSDFKPVHKLFSYKTHHPISLTDARTAKLKKESKTVSEDLKKEMDKIRKDVEEQYGVEAGVTTLLFEPSSKAEAGKDGVAVSSPIAHAIMQTKENAHIIFKPQASASAGPGGFAHAHSDLYVSYRNKIQKPLQNA